jgi:membrane associated rhomboid family serine protease
VSSVIVYFPANGWSILTRGGGGALVVSNALIVGAITGVSTPLLAWVGLRRIAIGRVIALGALGAAAGALSAALILGPILPTRLWGLTSPIVGAVAGTVAAGILLRFTIGAGRSVSAGQAA